MRAGQSHLFYEGDRSSRSTAAQSAYREYRRTIDPLWLLVEEHGFPELRRQVDRHVRTGATREPTPV